MPSLLENYVLPVVCPHCGAQIQKPVKWFRENRQMNCPCGTTLHLSTDELIPIIDALEAAMTRLIRPAPATTSGAAPG
jgi:hypothetical protein